MFRKTSLFLAGSLALSACATTNPGTQSARYSSMSTTLLWSEHRTTQSPMELALVEAELGTRGATVSSLSYLGQRTSGAVGRSLYSRANDSSNDTRNCSDFRTGAEAQKFFLSAGGPVSDPHNLDGDGDGFACEWGTDVQKIATAQRRATRVTRSTAPRRTSSRRCYVGPRGGTYTITASGRKNYGGC